MLFPPPFSYSNSICIFVSVLHELFHVNKLDISRCFGFSNGAGIGFLFFISGLDFVLLFLLLIIWFFFFFLIVTHAILKLMQDAVIKTFVT